MTKVSIIGTGRVGGTTAFSLAENDNISQLLLINKTKTKAEGLRADLMATFPEKGSKIIIGDHQDANDADIILITCGQFGAPSGSSLWDVNKPIIEDIFSKVKPKQDAKVVIITTPCDRTAKLVLKITGLPENQVIGFGGQLDVNRLKYLIHSDMNDFSKDIDAYFVGEHGKRGIAIFDEAVSDKKKIIENTRNFFGLYLADYGASTFGTANELAKLTEALLSKNKTNLCVSYYDTSHEIFVTWPCDVNRNGVVPVDIALGDDKVKFEELIKMRQQEETS
ncbi:MAG: hypothetical protein Q8R04_03445 [Nanoarchaeota archaeon]|nr:hypothetical protein [Nanoarchaeota archaeon]